MHNTCEVYLYYLSWQVFTLRPLTIVLPSREDKNHPIIDLDLHLPLFCFKSRELLQVSNINADDLIWKQQ